MPPSVDKPSSAFPRAIRRRHRPRASFTASSGRGRRRRRRRRRGRLSRRSADTCNRAASVGGERRHHIKVDVCPGGVSSRLFGPCRVTRLRASRRCLWRPRHEARRRVSLCRAPPVTQRPLTHHSQQTRLPQKPRGGPRLYRWALPRSLTPCGEKGRIPHSSFDSAGNVSRQTACGSHACTTCFAATGEWCSFAYTSRSRVHLTAVCDGPGVIRPHVALM